MRILLLNPKNIKGANYIIIPNIGLGYLASALLEKNHSVSILDCAKEDYDFNKLRRYLKNKDFDLIGISTYSSLINSVKEYIKVIKNVNKNIIVVIGGSHPTVEPIETLQILEDADFAFCGEAEIAFPHLVAQLEDNNYIVNKNTLGKIKNLIWRDNGRIICNEREVIKDLSQIRFPAWHLIEPHKYPLAPNGIFSKERKIAPVIATRGCFYSCAFCASPKISMKQIRFRPIEDIIEEIKLLREIFGIKEIHFMDENLTQNRMFAMKLFNKLIESRININWACPSGLRLDTLDQEMLSLMRKSGCYSFAVGIESGSQAMLNRIKKKLTIEEIKERLNLIKKVTKIRVTGFFIIGYPGETIYDIEKTIRFAVDLDIDRANFFNFTPFPGSEIYDELKEKGELRDIKYDNLYIHNINYSPDGISKSEMKKLQRKAHFRFYLRPFILFKLAKEIKSWFQIKILLQRVLKILFS